MHQPVAVVLSHSFYPSSIILCVLRFCPLLLLFVFTSTSRSWVTCPNVNDCCCLAFLFGVSSCVTYMAACLQLNIAERAEEVFGTCLPTPVSGAPRLLAHTNRDPALRGRQQKARGDGWCGRNDARP